MKRYYESNKSSENRGILIKGSITKSASQEERLVTAGLPLMKSDSLHQLSKRKFMDQAQKTLIVSNQEMKDIMKIVKLIEETGLLIKGN